MVYLGLYAVIAACGFGAGFVAGILMEQERIKRELSQMAQVHKWGMQHVWRKGRNEGWKQMSLEE